MLVHAIESIVDQVLAANARSVDEFRAGKEKAFNALVGQAMKATRGKANPQQVNEILRLKGYRPCDAVSVLRTGRAQAPQQLGRAR